MSDPNRTRSPVETAAASPDPAVRALALERMELEPRLARLDAFFAMYAATIVATPKTAPVAAKPAVVKPPPTVRSVQEAPVRDGLRAVFGAAAGPLTLREVHAAYAAANPGADDDNLRERLRLALHRGREMFPRTDDKRYFLKAPNGHAVA